MKFELESRRAAKGGKSGSRLTPFLDEREAALGALAVDGVTPDPAHLSGSLVADCDWYSGHALDLSNKLATLAQSSVIVIWLCCT